MTQKESFELKVGEEVKITSNDVGHGFNIGETVVVKSINQHFKGQILCAPLADEEWSVVASEIKKIK